MMITVHVQALEGIDTSPRILIEPESNPSKPEHEQAQDLLHALEKGLAPSSLIELGRLISIYHPA